MPHIRIRGMKLEEIQEISGTLINSLEEIMNVSRVHFTLEFIESTFVFDGKLNKNKYPFVNVNLFNKDDETMKKAAEAITNAIKVFDYEDVAVYFNVLNKEHYFENGEHF